MEDALARAGMKSDWPPIPEDTGGVLIHVQVGVGAEERPAELGFATLGSWVGNDSLLTAPRPGDGWDYRTSIIGKPNFLGRAGTVMVTVEGGTYGMQDSVLAILAARVRDRIPTPAASSRGKRRRQYSVPWSSPPTASAREARSPIRAEKAAHTTAASTVRSCSPPTSWMALGRCASSGRAAD